MRTLTLLAPISMLALLGLNLEKLAAQPKTSATSTQQMYQSQVRPLLQKYCFECHGAEKPKKDLRLDNLSTDFVKGDAADLETWHDVLNNLHRGEMPPRGKPQPTAKEHGVLVDWLNRAFVEARQQRESTGGKIVMRRLTSYEYQNTLEDLLGIQLNLAKDLLPEVPSRDGFLNNGSFLTTSSQHVRDFWATARLALSKALVVGEKPRIHQVHVEDFKPFGPAKGGKAGKGKREDSLSSYLLPDTALMAPMKGFPTEGPFRIRVNLQAMGPKTSMLAWFKLSKNNQTSLIIAKPEVSPSKDSQNVDIYGNIEDFPILVQFAAQRNNNIERYLCLSNVGNIHFFRGGNGSIYPRSVSAEQVKQALASKSDASLLKINFVEFEAPFYAQWPPASHQQILFASPNAGDEAKYAPEVIAKFMERAYRRPLRPGEADQYTKLFAAIRPKYERFEEAIRETLALVLISPDFLYLVEPTDGKAPRTPITDHQWASRLSYFLWNSAPDAELLRLAGTGGLKDAATRRTQVERLLHDDRAWRFIASFTDQWLNLPMLEKVAVDPEFHPDFDEDLKADMRRETQLFFNDFVKKDLNCLKLVDADFTYLTNRLAAHYGLSDRAGVRQLGSAFERVSLPADSRRGNGLLSHGSILLLNSDGVESHPIKRAVWVRNAILDDPPPEPPADVPELKTDDRAKNPRTLKQRIEEHRASQSCAHCHSRIDPWGIALEQYDALGRFRTSYASLTTSNATKSTETAGKAKKRKFAPPPKRSSQVSQPVDAKVELPDGHLVAGADGLKEYLLTQGKDRFARALVRKTLAYALGRSLEATDVPLVEELTQAFATRGYRYRELVIAISESEAFRTK